MSKSRSLCITPAVKVIILQGQTQGHHVSFQQSRSLYFKVKVKVIMYHSSSQGHYISRSKSRSLCIIPTGKVFILQGQSQGQYVSLQQTRSLYFKVKAMDIMYHSSSQGQCQNKQLNKWILPHYLHYNVKLIGMNSNFDGRKEECSICFFLGISIIINLLLYLLIIYLQYCQVEWFDLFDISKL